VTSNLGVKPCFLSSLRISRRPPECRAAAEPACREPRPRDRRHATDTFARRRSAPPSHRGANDSRRSAIHPNSNGIGGHLPQVVDPGGHDEPSCGSYVLGIRASWDQFVLDSPLEGTGFELVWGFSCQVVVSGLSQFFVRSGKAVLHPVACDQVRGARGRGQGTETVAKLGGMPPSGACVSQRLEA
jgi:hypothetical protein